MMGSLAIQSIKPLPEKRVRIEDHGFELIVQITLGCGCPTCAGGRWDARQFKVNAFLYSKRKCLRQVGLKYTGEASLFSCIIPYKIEGIYLVIVEATDPESGAAGRMQMNIRLYDQ